MERKGIIQMTNNRLKSPWNDREVLKETAADPQEMKETRPPHIVTSLSITYQDHEAQQLQWAKLALANSVKRIETNGDLPLGHRDMSL